MKIKEVRKSVHLTQIEVSKQTGIPTRTLQNWENRERQCPEWCERLVIKEILSLKQK